MRPLLILLAVLSLLAGLAAGLARLGWPLPVGGQLIALHGPIMAIGFFATLISLERAVAMRQSWLYLAPLGHALAALLWLSGYVSAGLFVALLASAVLSYGSLLALRLQPALHHATLLLACLALLAGNALWYWRGALPLPFWLAFLILTIAGERLELTRLLPRAPLAQRLFRALLGLMLLCLATLAVAPNATLPLRGFGLALALLACWLFHYDLARRNLKLTALPRYIAVCLLAGYAWLAFAGLLWLWQGALQPGWSYDAGLHAVLVGFVFSMVLGHAPIIIPALTGWRLRYLPAFYLPLALLHAALLLRVTAGLLEAALWQRLGGLGNVLALLGFVALLAYARWSSMQAEARPVRKAGAEVEH